MSRAKSRYEANRSRMIAYGRWQPYTDAQPARDHLAMLSRHGIGWMRAASLAGVSRGTVSKLLYGTPRSAPSRQVRPETEARILAVTPRLENMSPSAPVDATGTRRRLQALAATGWPVGRVAARLGWSRSKAGLVMRRDRVTVATALEVRAVYEQVAYRPCPAVSAYERAAISRSVAHARRMGWAPPAAWDDEEIDDPAARPRGMRRDEAA